MTVIRDIVSSVVEISSTPGMLKLLMRPRASSELITVLAALLVLTVLQKWWVRLASKTLDTKS